MEIIGTSPYDSHPVNRRKKAITACFTEEEFAALDQKWRDDGHNSISQWLRIQGLAALQPETSEQSNEAR